MASAALMTVMLEGASGTDQVELDALTLQLRAELLELDVERVDPVRFTQAPAGTKSGGTVALGVLVITLSPIALRGVFRFLEAWIAHRPVRRVRVEFGDDSIELENASLADQRRLVDAFIASQQTGVGSRVRPDGEETPAST